MRNTTPVEIGKPACARPPPARGATPIKTPGVEGKDRHLAGSCFGLQVGLGCLLCWFAASSVSAQKSDPTPVVASLSGSTVPAELFQKYLWETSGRWEARLAERPNGGIIEPHRAPTEGEAWEKFDADYRPHQPSSVPVIRQLESAKYLLDCATFGADRFCRNIQDNLQFKFANGRLRQAAPGDLPQHRLSANPWLGGLKDVRVKSDLKLRIGQPYVGVRIVIPFGN